MFKISANQLEAFRKESIRRAEARIAEYLRADFPDVVATRENAALISLVTSSVHRALAYGITGENDVRRFVEFCLLYGPDFERRLDVNGTLAPLLTSTSLQGHSKMQRLKQVVMDSGTLDATGTCRSSPQKE